jgi:ABC-type sugar transport system ATPase subunit
VAAIRLEGIEKVYPNGHVAIRPIDLDIGDGEFLVLVGPSGCGKSTFLRLVAGLESPTAGRILIDGADVTAQPPQARDLAMVFQSYALYPHMTVRENLAYGLKVRGVPRDVRAERVGAVAQALDLQPLLDRRPSQLSGGQRQRVALGRAMVRQPKAFLFDEPLSNLDPALRAQARVEIARLHQALTTTVVYVTHDQEEAMTLGGRVAVMRQGAIEQIAPPLDVYARPANTFVARFIGAPPMNLLPARALGIDAPDGALAGVRPHDMSLLTAGTHDMSPGAVRRPTLSGPGHVHAIVELVEPRGHDAVVHLRLDAPDTPVVLAVVDDEPPAVGSRVQLSVPGDRIRMFDGTNGSRL